jgi:erythronate-4-phosphate dehydrogenase
LKLVVDDAIVGAELALSCFGNVELRRGADIEPGDADALVIRSVTTIRSIAGSRVQFIGSATAGIDHVDLDALRGITFAHAPGCNAPAVVDYVLEATGDREGPVGIVGVGEIGRRLAAALPDREVLLNDPPRQERGDPGDWRSLDELVQRCAILSLHVPDIRTGPHPTVHLLDLDRVPPQTLVINTARGSAVDNEQLLRWPGRAVIDVWEDEPNLRWDLLHGDRVELATPHIAGYSRLGKATATAMIHAALARHLGVEPTITAHDILPLIPAAPAEPLRRTDARLRALLDEPEADRPRLFEALRRTYALR